MLAVQPLVMVVDAQALARGERLCDAQQQALAAAALIVLNKGEAVDENSRLLINKDISAGKGFWTEQGQLDLSYLPLHPQGILQAFLLMTWLWIILPSYKAACGQIRFNPSAWLATAREAGVLDGAGTRASALNCNVCAAS